VALAGGVDNVLARVRALLDESKLQLACHLVEYAIMADPSAKVHELRREVYEERSKRESSSMARNILNHAALASAKEKRDLAGGF
jgi:alkyl sulfatase BDS1-like metallo-beta-lactamase superfamily hydrolase